MDTSKKQLEQLELERPVIINSSKRLIINEIWYLKTDCAEDAELEKGKKRIKLLLLQALPKPKKPMGWSIWRIIHRICYQNTWISSRWNERQVRV